MNALKIFCSYALEDKSLKENFHAHLRRVLELQDVSIWYIDDVPLGKEREQERDRQLQAANIILFLVSADFIASNEHYDKEVLPAMVRYTSGEATVVPIILRPVNWKDTPLSVLSPLPADGKPITDSIWHTLDHAFVAAVNGIKAIIEHRDDVTSRTPIDIPRDAAAKQLAEIIQNFKTLRGEIASFVMLRGPKDFTLQKCESRYSRLYGDTMVFLASYLPESVTNNSEGFVEIVYRKTAELLRVKNTFDAITFFAVRNLIPYLAQLEKVGMQIDACVVTLESYQQKYFAV